MKHCRKALGNTKPNTAPWRRKKKLPPLPSKIFSKLSACCFTYHNASSETSCAVP